MIRMITLQRNTGLEKGSNYMADVFDIELYGIHQPNFDDMGSDEKYSENTASIIRTLYSFLTNKLNSTRFIEKRADEIDGSIFGMCVEEGYILLKSTADSKRKKIYFDGFLIPSGCSLRTMWRIARWQMLFVCARGWEKKGCTKLSINDIIDMAEAFDVPRNIENQIISYGQKLVGASHPINFVMSDFKCVWPIDFSDDKSVTTNELLNRDWLVLDSDNVLRQGVAQGKINKQRFPSVKKVELIRIPFKEFVTMRINDARTKEETRQIKEELKNMDYRHKSDVYVLRAENDKGMTYTKMFEEMKKAETENCDYEMINVKLKSFFKKSQKYFDTPIAEPEKKSIFDKFFQTRK